MIKNKRKVPNFEDDNVSTSKFINFIKLSKYQKRLIKFKSLLKDKKYSSITRKNFSNISYLKNKDESITYFEIKTAYNYIINQLDSLMKKLTENNFDYIYSCLIKIKNAINKILSNKIIIKRNNSYRSEIKIKPDKEDKSNSCNTFRRTYDKKFIISRDKDSFNKVNSFMNQTTSKRFFKINNIKKIKILKQRNTDLEDKLKTDKLKYLFCIGDQNKKIKELEKELNKKSIDSLTQEELKKYRCFPNYKKFELLDNNTKNNSSYNKSYKNDLLDLNKSEKEKEKDIIKNNIEYGDEIINKKELEENKILDREKSYFISHPKLKYVKDDLNMKSWKTNELLDTFPKNVIRHRFTSRSQKNHLIVFPSSLNQIMVNLEKLRIQNDFKRIEFEFKEKEFKKIKK